MSLPFECQPGVPNNLVIMSMSRMMMITMMMRMGMMRVKMLTRMMTDDMERKERTALRKLMLTL